MPDYDDPGDASEDDLVAVTIGGLPADLGGFLELRAHTPIKVWNDPHKGAGNLLIPDDGKLYKRWPVGSFPGTMWVEGYDSAGFLSGESGLRLWYSTTNPPNQYGSYPGAGYNPDLVSVTIVQVDMVMDGVSDTEEETVGGFVAVGGLKRLVLNRAQPANLPIGSGHYMTLKVCSSALFFVHEFIEFGQGVAAKLANPLSGQSELFGYLFERHGPSSAQAVMQPQDLRLPRLDPVQQPQSLCLFFLSRHRIFRHVHASVNQSSLQ